MGVYSWTSDLIFVLSRLGLTTKNRRHPEIQLGTRFASKEQESTHDRQELTSCVHGLYAFGEDHLSGKQKVQTWFGPSTQEVRETTYALNHPSFFSI